MVISQYVNPYFDIKYTHVIDTNFFLNNFHCHDGYEIYFFISGDVDYFIDNRIIPLKYGDLIVLNNNNLHKPYVKSNKPYERITVNFNHKIVQILDTQDYSLLSFCGNSLVNNNQVILNRDQIDEVLKLLLEFEEIHKMPHGSNNILEFAQLIKLLTCINNIYIQNKGKIINESKAVTGSLKDILDYVDNNLENDLSLENLSKIFHLNKSYMCRLFKKSTGDSLHNYILMKRVVKAKKYLLDGKSVSEACILSGFNDYANFIKMFKKVTGMTPGQFKKEMSIPKEKDFYKYKF